MARDDYAIVVGIGNYPELSPRLDAPESDAKAFYDWVVSPRGGAVPKRNAHLITSPRVQRSKTATDAVPIVTQVLTELEKLQDIAQKNSKKPNGRLRTGRRLYLYFAGHGFAPRDDQTALLMANANPLRTGTAYHILGPWTADWFYKACFFDEIALFMDCCRDNQPNQGLNLPWGDRVCPDLTKVKRFYGYGTVFSRPAREQRIKGVNRGVFTATLLSGLNGAAADPATGKITSLTLKAYLFNNMRSFFGKDNPDQGKVYTDPDIHEYPEASEIVFSTISRTKVPKFSVVLRVPPNLRGQKIQILQNGNFAEVASRTVKSGEWRFKLEKGLYLALAAGKQVVIEVTGKGETSVSL